MTKIHPMASHIIAVCLILQFVSELLQLVGHVPHPSSSEATPSMIPLAQDDTLRKGFQRLQQENGHNGPQPLKRIASQPTAAAVHLQKISQSGIIPQPVYRAAGFSPGDFRAPAGERDHVKMRQAVMPPSGGGGGQQRYQQDQQQQQQRRASRPVSHHQAVSNLDIYRIVNGIISVSWHFPPSWRSSSCPSSE